MPNPHSPKFRPQHPPDATSGRWMPIRVNWVGEVPEVECMWFGNERCTEPFYRDTVRRLMHDPAQPRPRRVMPLDELNKFTAGTRRVPPTGFIFHWSRCGSTLLAQMLAALPRNIVISEPPPLDNLLWDNSDNAFITRDQRLRWLRTLLPAFGQACHGEQHYFLKFDSWHMLDLPLILSAFPNVPWVFLFRDPVEIMVSHRRIRGSHMVPGKIEWYWIGVNQDRIDTMTLDEYGAQILAEIGTAACTYSHLGRSSLFINYTELPDVVWQKFGYFFELAWTPDEVALLKAAATRNSKAPTELHVDDRADKQNAATPELRELIAEDAGNVYLDLEKKRAKRL